MGTEAIYLIAYNWICFNQQILNWKHQKERMNQVNYKPQPYVLRKSRKRIETLFSQLCDQFIIRRNYAKTIEGFKTRILAKITALTLVQYINKFIFDRPINKIKNQLI